MTPAPADDTAPSYLNDLDFLDHAFKQITQRLPDSAAEAAYLGRHSPAVYMEAPTYPGQKFWEGTALQDSVLIRFGPVGRPGGQEITIESRQCKSGKVKELYFRAKAKLKQGKGYQLIRTHCNFPLP